MEKLNNVSDAPYKVLTAERLKLIAVFFMLIDHTAGALVPASSQIYLIMRTLGRITMPIMAYFIAEGYRHTKNVKAYAGRILLFAFISIVPFSYLISRRWLPFALVSGRVNSSYLHLFLPFANKTLVVFTGNVMFTLFFGLVNILMWDKAKLPTAVKISITVFICIVSSGFDWGYWCVLLCFVFWKFRERPAEKWGLYLILTLSYIFFLKLFKNPLCIAPTCSFAWFRLGMLLPMPLIFFLYNGEKGKTGKLGRWFFYVFYPAHLLAIDLILALRK